MPPILLHGLVAALYAALAAIVWKSHSSPKSSSGTLPPNWHRVALLVPLLLHGFVLWQDLFSASELRFGFGHALSVMLWLALAIYWIESWFLRIEGLQAVVLPVAAVCVLLPAIFPGLSLQDYAHSAGFRIHLVVAMAAYSLFTIAALQALFMAVLERRLHSGTLTGPFSQLPPLLTLERSLFRLLGTGFALLTLTILSGAFFSEQLFGRAWRFDHKTLFALISWGVFGALLVGRWRYGWRGRTALRWILAGFGTLLLAYVGSRFVLEVILRRGLGE